MKMKVRMRAEDNKKWDRKEVKEANKRVRRTKREGERVPGACISALNGENWARSHRSLATNQSWCVCRGAANRFTPGWHKLGALSQPADHPDNTHTHTHTHTHSYRHTQTCWEGKLQGKRWRDNCANGFKVRHPYSSSHSYHTGSKHR